MKQRLALAGLLAKNLLSNLYGYISTKHEHRTDKTVFFYLRDFRNEPYYFPIFFAFKQQGYLIYLTVSVEFIANTFGGLADIFRWKNLRLGMKQNRDAFLLITDDEDFYKSYKKSKKILLKAFLFDRVAPNLLPFPMHPNMYTSGQFKRLEDIRARPRNQRIFFSGNTSEEAYSNKIFANYFKMLNRVEVIDSLINNLGTNELFVVTNKEDKQCLKNMDCKSMIVVYKWKWTSQTSEGMDIKLRLAEWLDSLGNADFFICCPGVAIPHSHNAIEAMSVGTIPLLQYGDWMNPALIDRVNCMQFKNETDLINRVREILQMEKSVIDKMRKHVIDYYETHLSYTNGSVFKFFGNEGQLLFYNEQLLLRNNH